jgi:hypothetical protein
MSKEPITDYAFLDGRTLRLLGQEALPNYHLAHTYLLWGMYQISPSGIRESLYPSGILSSLCGALAVGLTFLIGVKLKIREHEAFMVAVVTGLIPSIFYHSLIGEVYALGLFSILLFLYLFLSNQLVLSSLAFLFTNLLSPMYGMAFAFYYLNDRSARTVIASVCIGAASLAAYLFIYYSVLDIDILKIFDTEQVYFQSTSGLYTYAKTLGLFSVILLLNVGPCVVYFTLGVRRMIREYRRLAIGVCVVLSALILPPLTQPVTMVELGSFFLPVFWVLSIPIGIGMSRSGKLSFVAIFVLACMYLVTQTVWLRPNEQSGRRMYEVGQALRDNRPDSVKIVGHWKYAIGVAVGKYGWDLRSLNENYFEYANPGDRQLVESGENELFLIEEKQSPWQGLLKQIMGKMDNREREPMLDKKITTGGIQKVFETDEMHIYKWKNIENGGKE